MKKYRINTFFLVLFNLSLILGFSYFLFSGELEKAFLNDNNKRYLPAEGYIVSINKSTSSTNQYPRQSVGRSKQRSSVNRSQDNNSIPVNTKMESFYGGNAKSRRAMAARGASSSSEGTKLIDTEDDLSRVGSASGPALYAGSRQGGVNVSEGTYAGSTPFNDGVSNLPRASVPRGPGSPGGTILVDPQTDPLEKNRIPVGDGLGILLLFAAAFAGVVYSKKVIRSNTKNLQSNN